MKIYLILILISLAVPLALSFEPKMRFYQKFPALFPALISTTLLFVLWDVVAVERGDWRFNKEFLLGPHLFGVPIEEILFFLCIPFCCLFIYEIVCYFLKDKIWLIPSWVFALIVTVLILVAAAFYRQSYTFTVLNICALTLVAMSIIKPTSLRSRNYWIFLAITYLPFMLVNSALTSIPVVIYHPQAVWGIRIATIPLEDFFFSYALLSINFIVYQFLQDSARRRGQLRKLATELSDTKSML